MDADLLEQLRHPEIYPGDIDAVEILQTHLSVVCLAGDTAYKLKKPLRLPFVDFSTLEKRRRCCEEEVRLNRRLCPSIYRGVRPVFRQLDGSITFSAEGEPGSEIIDYAVEMERLPEDRMMNRLLAENAVPVDSVREIAGRMAQFHAQAERSEAVRRAGDPAKLGDFALANFEETRGAIGELFDPQLHPLLRERTEADFDRLLPVLRRRAGEGRIVDGHGDLHARNICLSDPIAIYDCIEFNRDFRCGDTATENAFLVMDLEYRGHRELAAAYLDAYIEAGGDEEQRRLMRALVRYRLMVRAKVSAIASAETELSDEEHRAASESARRHFHRVAASFIEESGPWIILACGLPGSGKSHVFTMLADQAGWEIYSSDQIRKELAGVSIGETLPEICYLPEFSGRTYREMLRRASKELEKGRVVLADANFRGRSERAMAREMAAEAGARLVIVLVETPEAEILHRLTHRKVERAGTGTDADIAVYRKLKSEFEAPDASECDRLIRIAGDMPAESAIPAILAELIGY